MYYYYVVVSNDTSGIMMIIFRILLDFTLGFVLDIRIITDGFYLSSKTQGFRVSLGFVTY